MVVNIDMFQQDLSNLIDKTKASIDNANRIAIDQAWKILQLAVVGIIQDIEDKVFSIPGKDKKTIAMDLLSKFYDSVFLVINIPFVPSFMQPIISRYLKMFLMILVSSTIDAMVATFKDTGIFTSANLSIKINR